MLTPKAVSFSTSGDNLVIAGVTGQAINVYALALTLALPTTVTINDGAGNTHVYQSVSTLVLDPVPWQEPLYTIARGVGLTITLSAANACKGTIWYDQR